MSRKIEQEVTIAATPEEIWDALTDAAKIACWFAPEARVEPRAGGSFVVSWGPGFEAETKIDLWDPHRRLRTVNPKTAQTVDYIIEGHGGGTTTLRLVDTMADSPDWEDEIDGKTLGWQIFLGTLRDYFARHRGSRCKQAFFFLPVAGDATAAWRRLVGPSALDLGEAQAGSRVAATIDGERLDAEIVLRRDQQRPYGVVFEVPALETRVYVSLERSKGHSFLWLNLFAYAPSLDPAALTARWKPLVAAAIKE